MKLVDYYNNLKPWQIAVVGYEVFDKYIEYYQAVSRIIELEFGLPRDNREASRMLKISGKPFVDWFPFRHKIIGEFVYRSIWGWRRLARMIPLFRRKGK